MISCREYTGIKKLGNMSRETLIVNLNSVVDDSVPSWAKVLIDCFKALNDELQRVSKLVEWIQKLESLNEVQKSGK